MDKKLIQHISLNPRVKHINKIKIDKVRDSIFGYSKFWKTDLKFSNNKFRLYKPKAKTRVTMT